MTPRSASPSFCKIVLRGSIGRPDAAGDAIYFDVVREKLRAARGAKSLLVVIDSDGGLVRESDKIYEVIRAHPAEHKVCIIEAAASAAIKVALASPKRWAQPDAFLMIHSIQVEPGRRWTAAKHEETAARLKSSDAELAAFYSRRCGGAPADWFLRELHTETPMRLETALSVGLIHRVLPAPAKPLAAPPPYARQGQQPRQFAYLTRVMSAP